MPTWSSWPGRWPRCGWPWARSPPATSCARSCAACSTSSRRPSAQKNQTSQRHQPADERADEEVLRQPVHLVLLLRRGELGPAQEALGGDHDRCGGEVAGQRQPEDEDPLQRTEQTAALEGARRTLEAAREV